MDALHLSCCGLDVHKKTVVACAITQTGKQTRTFGTMTAELLEMAEWLHGHGVTHIAMESTGVLWQPVYNVLELHDFEAVMVVNAQHIKAVPGRKTDVNDAEWLAQLLRYGLVRASFIPSKEQRELRELVRYRKSMIRARADEVNRLQKTLEGANIKLSAVAADVTGKSGRAMLEALIGGETDPSALAEYARGRMKAKKGLLRAALQGVVGTHQKQLLRMQLDHIDYLVRLVSDITAQIDQRMSDKDAALANIDSIPGLSRKTAQNVIAEIGVDMSRFPTSGHLASWAGVCPGQNESAGKRKSGRVRDGNPWLRETLVEVANAAARTRNTYLSAQYRRIAARRGHKRAALALAHTILTIIYHVLKRNVPYAELGADYFVAKARPQSVRRAVRQLEHLGYSVTLAPTSVA